ncbi:uncharacterized protein DUF2577 [Anaerobacterium chartisolvens]|uniref:Uncharacterized protein DUF2577 n=1 Tax=Anaerobacterium chartisolvens TaxID=1297424 RepID=A0A369AY67_9FIRM|nr:DUF2577 family protein [Anaerobacterium chartisolvens]RCX13268.1 uncharacterized protein DUF2577 [Anaerobacterium chartisolvens]
MGAAELVNLIRKEAGTVIAGRSRGFELATVISPYPGLVIRVDNMKAELSRTDLVVCERLMSGTRIVSLKSEPGVVRDLGHTQQTAARDSNSLRRGSGTLSGSTGEAQGHSHQLNGLDMENAGIELSYAELKFEDTLKAGDRVLVQEVPGGQKYIVIDRVVEYG